MRYKKSWIASLILLTFLSFNSYGQGPYVKKHYRGDDIPLDSFAVMDLGTYAGIRKGAMLYEKLSGTDRDIINKSDSIINQFNNLITANNLRMDVMMKGIEKRDGYISQLNGNINELASMNLESLDQLDSLKKEIKRPWLSAGFWGGLAVGIVGTLLIVN